MIRVKRISLATVSPPLYSRHKFWEERWKAHCAFARTGDQQGKGRCLNGVECFHLIIISDDLNENQVMLAVCMGTYNEWKGGQVLRKRYDEVEDGQNKMRGESGMAHISASVYD